MHPFSMSILSAVVENGRVVVSYKLGLADGITLYGRRAAEPDFSPLVEDEPGPFIDDRPNFFFFFRADSIITFHWLPFELRSNPKTLAAS